MNNAAQELRKRLAGWDRRSKDDIGEIFQDFREAQELSHLLSELLSDAELQVGATWLLKRGLESRVLDPPTVGPLIWAHLPELAAPEARLHVLQIFHRLPIPGRQKKRAERFVRSCFESPHKFVVAWAYAGFHALADQHPEYREEALQFIALGLEDGPASTKARIRNLQAKGFRQ
ncbi:MAG: hypothetical protein AAGA23_02290 [Pseudomonadota bacterium]